MSVRLTYDEEANALYLYLRGDIPSGAGGIAKTVEIVGEPHPVEEWVMADFDSEGRLLGLEFLSLESFLRYAAIEGGGLDPEELVAASLQKL
jgi:uncharacterized protein YuzE